MATREEVEAEVAAVNKLMRNHKGEATPCRACDGLGYKEYPLFGDPALGYTREGCGGCAGTGIRVRFGRK
jgi:hypothetical protein